MVHNNNNIRTQQRGKMFFLYDSALANDIANSQLFDHEEIIPGKNTAIGRGAAVFFKYNAQSFVYKHYQRGGLVAKILHDQYFGLNVEGTRAFREWYLLNQMQALGLPSPVPVAARVIKNGWFYTADLVMQEIQDTQTLADGCLNSELSAELWYKIGRCIKQFHDEDVYHADLNARNILSSASNNVYLVDFDKSYIRMLGSSWKVSNLSRLNRSLEKFKMSNAVFYYTSSNWNQLLAGYNDAVV